ncbi:unnamed protein product [Toxocara canis]|uniref:Metallophosphoesterase n=1 Tax=Toxocara canis TaxID=6265 RepID=A0A183UTT4_TOXCA|nr:unnamed protein product [Toxocara canis]VDM43225.1 unnamed protein product [Toxocara canis]
MSLRNTSPLKMDGWVLHGGVVHDTAFNEGPLRAWLEWPLGASIVGVANGRCSIFQDVLEVVAESAEVEFWQVSSRLLLRG